MKVRKGLFCSMLSEAKMAGSGTGCHVVFLVYRQRGVLDVVEGQGVRTVGGMKIVLPDCKVQM